MSSQIKHYCDWPECKRERAGAQSILVFSHKSPDASGNGSEVWDAVFDLCEIHIFAYLNTLIESLQTYGKRGLVKMRTPFEIVKDLGIKFELR